MKSFINNVLTIIAAIVIAVFIKEFFLEFHLIPTGSMIPNVNVGDRIIVNRLYFGIQNPLYNAKLKKSIMLVAANPLYKANLPFSDFKYFVKFNKHQPKRFDVLVFVPPETPIFGKEYYFDGDHSREPIYFEPPQLIGERYVKRLIGLPGEKLEIKNGDIYINDKKLIEPQVKNNDFIDFGPVRIPPKYYFFMGDNRPRSSDSRYWGAAPEDNILGKSLVVIWPPKSIKLIK